MIKNNKKKIFILKNKFKNLKMSTSYTCSINNCGRKFTIREHLEEHIMRRH